MKHYQHGEVMLAVMVVMMVAMAGLGYMGMGHGDNKHAGQSGDPAQQTTTAPATSAAPAAQ